MPLTPPAPAHEEERGDRTRWQGVVLAVAAAASLVYLRWTPPVPDLAAQVARVGALRATVVGVWWTGWLAGLSLPSYSEITPQLMAAVGVAPLGAAAAFVSLLAACRLMRAAHRPVLGTITFACFDAADLLVGRVTFAVGLAFGLLALVALMAGRRWQWIGVAAVAAALSLSASPLAGLFTGLAVMAVLLVDGRRRVRAGIVASVLLTLAGADAFRFPSPGVMPTTTVDMLPSLGALLAVALFCRAPVLRVGAVLAAAATLGFLVFPGAVGENITRLSWVASTPVLVACGRFRLRRPRSWSWIASPVLVVVIVATAVNPSLDVITQVTSSRDDSTSPAFYQDLVHQVLAEQAAHPASRGQRIEVLDPRTHWSSVYVADRIPMARGWDRQADASLNPLFYTPGALDAASYTAWLHSLAVGWVAVPDTPLDFASVEEGQLIAHGVPALRLAWSDRRWSLYRVTSATDLVDGARLVDVGPAGVTIDADRPGVVRLRLRWDSALLARSVPASPGGFICPERTPDGMLSVTLPAGRWRIGVPVKAAPEASEVPDCSAADADSDSF